MMFNSYALSLCLKVTISLLVTMSLVWTNFGLEKNEEGRIKTKDIAVCWKRYSHVHS